MLIFSLKSNKTCKQKSQFYNDLLSWVAILFLPFISTQNVLVMVLPCFFAPNETLSNSQYVSTFLELGNKYI